MPASHTYTCSSPDAPLLIQLPTAVPGKAMEVGQSALTPAIHVGASEKAPGSWLQPGLAPTATTTYGINQWMEDFSVSSSL